MMLEEYEQKKEKQLSLMRPVMDYVMGIVIIVIGLFFLFLRHKAGIGVNYYLRKPDILDKVLGGICLLYGCWRIYRGYKKK
jgi:uncharacterized membrane protein (DUF106 family)